MTYPSLLDLDGGCCWCDGNPPSSALAAGPKCDEIRHGYSSPSYFIQSPTLKSLRWHHIVFPSRHPMSNPYWALRADIPEPIIQEMIFDFLFWRLVRSRNPTPLCLQIQKSMALATMNESSQDGSYNMGTMLLDLHRSCRYS